MHTEFKSDKNVRNLLFKRIINEVAVGDNRSEFDKNVNVKEFRERYFSNSSEFIKHNPGYKIRTAQLRTNADAVVLIKNDLHHSLIKQIPAGQLEPDDDICNIHHFSRYNAIGEDFMVETQMLIANRKDEKGNNVMALGYGFIYLSDSVSGNKLFIGVIKLRKDKADPIMHINAHMVLGVFTDIIKHLSKGEIVGFFVDKSFAGLRDTLLKRTKKYQVKISAVNTINEIGRKTQHKMIVDDLKSLSPSFIDVIQLTDIRKHMYQ